MNELLLSCYKELYKMSRQDDIYIIWRLHIWCCRSLKTPHTVCFRDFFCQIFTFGGSSPNQWINLLSKCQNHEDDCANFCGFLRKAELYPRFCYDSGFGTFWGTNQYLPLLLFKFIKIQWSRKPFLAGISKSVRLF